MRALKYSGEEWLGDIPENWEKTKIGLEYRERNEKVSDLDYPPLSVTMKGIVPQLDSAAKSADRQNRKKVNVGDFVIIADPTGVVRMEFLRLKGPAR